RLRVIRLHRKIYVFLCNRICDIIYLISQPLITTTVASFLLILSNWPASVLLHPSTQPTTMRDTPTKKPISSTLPSATHLLLPQALRLIAMFTSIRFHRPCQLDLTTSIYPLDSFSTIETSLKRNFPKTKSQGLF